MQKTTVKKLEWDSDFFGYNVGKLNIIGDDNSNWNIEKLKKSAEEYRLVYIFSKTKIHETKIKLVDQKVTYTQKLNPNVLEKSIHQNIINFNPETHKIENIEELALISGTYSRFNTDANFTNHEYVKLYKQWILNSINDPLDTDVLIYQLSQKILGFVTLEHKDNDFANIGLVAVSKKARGKGIATMLIEACKKLAVEREKKFLQVVTQGDNKPAIRLYEKCQFEKSDLTYIYHFWNL